jgi:hypothetical protein
MRALLALSTAALLAGACNPYDPDLGETPFRCGTTPPLCPEGYACVGSDPASAVCVKPGGSGDGPDGGGNTGQCTGDNGNEPNEDTGDPTITPIPDFQSDYNVVGVEICPEGDVDVYQLRIDVPGKNVKVEVMHEAANGQLTLDVLNGTGMSVASGMAVGGNSNLLRAEVNNLPTGTWFARVQGAGAIRNSYDLVIEVTGP